jgi:hypothetical protein
MVTRFLAVTLVVILLQSRSGFCDEETPNKRHIPDSEDNQTVPKVGPALKPYTVLPIFHRLETKIGGKVVEGEDLSLEVSLAEERGKINSCQWISPSGNVYRVEKDNVVNSQGLNSKNNFYVSHSKLAKFTENRFGDLR